MCVCNVYILRGRRTRRSGRVESNTHFHEILPKLRPLTSAFALEKADPKQQQQQQQLLKKKKKKTKFTSRTSLMSACVLSGGGVSVTLVSENLVYMYILFFKWANCCILTMTQYKHHHQALMLSSSLYLLLVLSLLSDVDSSILCDANYKLMQ